MGPARLPVCPPNGIQATTPAVSEAVAAVGSRSRTHQGRSQCRATRRRGAGKKVHVDEGREQHTNGQARPIATIVRRAICALRCVGHRPCPPRTGPTSMATQRAAEQGEVRLRHAHYALRPPAVVERSPIATEQDAYRERTGARKQEQCDRGLERWDAGRKAATILKF